MTASKVASRPSGRGAAARSEVNGKGKTAKFRGLTLVLPKECPGEVLFAVEADNVSDVLRTLVGETQYLDIRHKVAADKLTLDQTRKQLVDLCTSIFDIYGITSGE